jgi:hypothetical protein
MSEIRKWAEPRWQPQGYRLLTLKGSGHDRHFARLLISAHQKKTPYSHSSIKSTCSNWIFRFFPPPEHTPAVLHLLRGVRIPGARSPVRLNCVWWCVIVRSESRCALRLRYVDLLSESKFPLQCAVVLLYSVVKHRLKCNTGKVRNYLIWFLLTIFVSIEVSVFLFESFKEAIDIPI